MKRKVNQIGPATLMVSLPAKWVKKHNIKKGDEVDVLEQEGKLLIGGEGVELAKKTTVNLKDVPHINEASDNFYKRLFSNAYKKGFDEIEVIFPGKNVLHKVADAISNLLGYEIFDQTEHRCLIRSLASEKEEEFERMIRKSFLLMKQIAEMCYNDIKQNKLENLENIKKMRDNIQKYTDFCRRLINKKIYKNNELALYNYIICMRIVLITNKYRYMYDYCIQNKLKPDADVLNYFSKTNEIMDIFYETYYKHDTSLIEKIDAIKKELVQGSYKLLASKKGHNNVLTHLLAEVVRLVYDNSSQLMGIIL
jgi:phosphate uptake regulator